jgi:hypothetical protein
MPRQRAKFDKSREKEKNLHEGHEEHEEEDIKNDKRRMSDKSEQLGCFTCLDVSVAGGSLTFFVFFVLFVDNSASALPRSPPFRDNSSGPILSTTKGECHARDDPPVHRQDAAR